MEAFPVVRFHWLGFSWHGFGLSLTLGGLLAYLLLKRQDRLNPGQIITEELMPLCLALGLIFARLVYALFSWQLVFLDPMEGTFLGLAPLLRVNQGGLSFYGMVLGVLLAGLLHARRVQQPPVLVLDRMALPLGVFSCFALGAQILGGAGYGEEVAPWLQWFPAAVENTYGEWSAAVFAYQALGALLICLALWRMPKSWPKGSRMLALLIPLNALQLFFESLRQDDYPRLSLNAFVRVNQLLALAFLLGLLAVLVRKNPRHRLGYVLSLAFAAGLVLLAEFNEKLPFPRPPLYACSFASVCLMGMYWVWSLSRSSQQRHAQAKDAPAVKHQQMDDRAAIQ